MHEEFLGECSGERDALCWASNSEGRGKTRSRSALLIRRSRAKLDFFCAEFAKALPLFFAAVFALETDPRVNKFCVFDQGNRMMLLLFPCFFFERFHLFL